MAGPIPPIPSAQRPLVDLVVKQALATRSAVWKLSRKRLSEGAPRRIIGRRLGAGERLILLGLAPGSAIITGASDWYVDAGSGEVVAKRTRWWRFYEFMSGLHIMDPAGREDTHNPWIIVFSLVSVTTVILAIIMLPLTLRRRPALRKD